jgi:hypothetical protein
LLWLFWRQSLAFYSRWSGPRPSYFSLPTVAGMTGTHHQAQIFSIVMGLANFCPSWPWTEILPISASQVARIIGVSHPCLVPGKILKYRCPGLILRVFNLMGLRCGLDVTNFKLPQWF